MAKVKIGKKEYELESLSSLDIKVLEKKKEDEKITDYDYSYLLMLHAIKKFNSDVCLTLDQFMDEFPIKDLKKKFEEIDDAIGLDFKMGVGKSEDGKIQSKP